GLAIPLSARVRNYVDVNGRSTFMAGVRASTRTSGLLLSNTLDYSRTRSSGFETNAQLFGNFDLSTFSRSDTRARFSLGYRVLPDPDITNAGFEIDHALDERTSLRGSANYDFGSKAPSFGLSGIRDFDRFSLALDGNYSFSNDSYYVGLRLGFSLGRDPLSKRVYMAKPGVATSGGAALRAFQDMDGDGVYGPSDRVLPDVDFVAFNQTAKTDKAGLARISGLGTGRGIGVQIDPSSLPDIDLAPAKPGIELVPRAGRLQTVDYAVIAVSEIEGIASFVSDSGTKGVSGVKLQLADENGKVVGIVKTELDGYYFFERVPPGRYRITLDPDQASRLNLCPVDFGTITVGFESSLVAKDIEIGVCAIDRPVIARAEETSASFGSE
ncbi:MAG TPA: SdrD B-like domain-containing protein, partial [Erythrobacter sp.]|nr:SdrD B-like domain-containing protein [Erythrobacter sp.]